MAQNLGTWLVKLGNDGAARNAAAACAEQRAAKARTDALMRRFAEAKPTTIRRLGTPAA